jgi:hypothetical protein
MVSNAEPDIKWHVFLILWEVYLWLGWLQALIVVRGHDDYFKLCLDRLVLH